MKKRILLGLTAALLIVSMVGCGKKAEEPKDDANQEAADNNDSDDAEVTEAPAEETATPEPTVDPHAGKVQSKLTGKWISKKSAKNRPYAVMINNIEYAGNRHAGISKAGVVYEAKVEGGITRMMAIFENPKDISKIGSVRSARHYYVSVASEYDAIFVHFGHTKFALDKIDKLGMDNLSGLSGIGGTVFYRDNNISAPHNAFASSDGLAKGTKALKYRTKYKKGYEGHYKWYPEDTDLTEGKKAMKVTVQFSGYTAPYFIYDKKAKVYKRYQYGHEHMDVLYNKQLTFKNIIIQNVDDEPIVPGHPKDYRTINFENAKGTGKYITNGKAIDITWEKNEKAGVMKYYTMDGNELVINPGKTYVALLPDDNSKLTIAKKAN